MKHEALVQAAKDAIDAVHGDSSVSQEQTVESLEEIVEHAELLRVTVADEIEQAGKSDPVDRDRDDIPFAEMRVDAGEGDEG